MRRAVIIGGGISGLALAHRLQERCPTAEVLVLEERSRLGGTIGTVEREGFRVEAGPNGFLDNKPFALGLSRELGLAERLQPASEAAGRNRFLLLDGKLRALPAGLVSFLRSDVLSWVAKVRLLTERFRPAGKPHGDETIDAFARRRAGGEVADTLADAFVTGIYAGDPKLLSIQATFPRLANFEREHGSVMRGLAHARRERRGLPGSPAQRVGTMYSFRAGMGELIDGLRQALRTPPLLGAAARRVRRTDHGWRVEADGRDSWSADTVVLTCPAYRQAERLADEAPDLAEKIAGIPYNRVAVVALGYRAGDVPHALDGFGYLSPQRARRDVLGVQWCSSIFPERAPPGAVLLRAMCGGWNRPDIVDWPEGRLLAAVRAELAQALRIRSAPIFHHVVRWDRAIPQYHVGHLERVAWIEQRAATLPGLYLGGNAYRGVAINDCIEQAQRLAERVAAS